VELNLISSITKNFDFFTNAFNNFDEMKGELEKVQQ